MANKKPITIMKQKLKDFQTQSNSEFKDDSIFNITGNYYIEPADEAQQLIDIITKGEMADTNELITLIYNFFKGNSVSVDADKLSYRAEQHAVNYLKDMGISLYRGGYSSDFPLVQYGFSLGDLKLLKSFNNGEAYNVLNGILANNVDTYFGFILEEIKELQAYGRTFDAREVVRTVYIVPDIQDDILSVLDTVPHLAYSLNVNNTCTLSLTD